MAIFFAGQFARLHHAEERTLPEDVEHFLNHKLKKRRAAGTKEGFSGTPQHIYLKWIRGEIDRENACLELPFTIMVLVAFAMLSLSYMQQDLVKIVEEAIVTDIAENANFAWAHNFGHKSIGDVNSYADFWSWCRLGLTPLLVPAAPWSYSEDLQEAVPQQAGLPAYDVGALPTRRPFPGYRRPTPVRGDYLRYNRIVGGFRFRQRAAEASESSCHFPGESSTFRSYIGKRCTEKSQYELPPDLFATETFDDPRNEEWFFSDVEPHEVLIQRLIDLEDGCASATAQNRTCLCKWCSEQKGGHPWLTELTQRVEISFIIYNAQYGIYSMAGVNFWFTRAGHIHKRINVRSSWAGLSVRDPVILIVFLVTGFIWLFSNIYLFRSEGREIVDQIRKKGKPWYMTMVEDYLSWWNVVDWVSISIASVILGLFLHLNATISIVSDSLGEVVFDMLAGRVGIDPEYMELIRDFYKKFDDMSRQERFFRFWLCLYPLVLMLRLFKSFAAQPRLAVVTETFKHALTDMVHFFLVFCSVYFCMSINAVLFFGQDDVNFSRLDWALFSCWRAMLGDWDWDSMSRIGRMKAFIWLFIFMLVMVLILLNILVSILMESYASAKATAENADSMFGQVVNMLRRSRETKEKKRVRLSDIEDWLMQDADQDEQAAFSSKRMLFPLFRVTIDRSMGDDLALDLKHQETTLQILSVNDGVAKKWNVANPLLEMRVADEIVEVNGVRGDPNQLQEELDKPNKLVIRLRRKTATREYLELLEKQASGNSEIRTSTLKSQGLYAVPARKTSKDKPEPKKAPPREVAFLMDLVEGIPENQALRTLRNSRDEEDRLTGEDFTPQSLEGSLHDLLNRISASTMCAGWLKFKLRESAEAEKIAAEPEEYDMQAYLTEKSSHVRTEQQEQRDAIADVRAVAEARTSDLAEDVAAVLGEEMQGLERRQKEQQRNMVHTQESLQGLRQMLVKLGQTCEEVGNLAGDGGLSNRSRNSQREVIQTSASGSSAKAPLNRMTTIGDDLFAAQRELEQRGKDRGRQADYEPLNNYKYSQAVGGRRQGTQSLEGRSGTQNFQ